MAKGIKKIKYSGGMIYPQMSVPNVRLTIEPDKWVWFDIEWEADTTIEDKKNAVVWLRQSDDRTDIIKSVAVPSTNKYGFKLSSKTFIKPLKRDGEPKNAKPPIGFLTPLP